MSKRKVKKAGKSKLGKMTVQKFSDKIPVSQEWLDDAETGAENVKKVIDFKTESAAGTEVPGFKLLINGEMIPTANSSLTVVPAGDYFSPGNHDYKDSGFLCKRIQKCRRFTDETLKRLLASSRELRDDAKPGKEVDAEEFRNWRNPIYLATLGLTGEPAEHARWYDVTQAEHANLIPERVIFVPPATIVYWEDGTKTVVKTSDDEHFDHEKGLAMALVKKVFSSRNEFKRVLSDAERPISADRHAEIVKRMVDATNRGFTDDES